MDNRRATNDAQLFLVRVWQHLSQFRASVRRVGEDERHWFTEPGQLGEYLRDASDGEPPPAGGRDEDLSDR